MTAEKTSKSPAKAVDAAKHADVANLSYEQARDELVQVVAELEAGSVSLEASLTLWERGEALANQCELWLTGARKRLDDAIKAKDSNK